MSFITIILPVEIEISYSSQHLKLSLQNIMIKYSVIIPTYLFNTHTHTLI